MVFKVFLRILDCLFHHSKSISAEPLSLVQLRVNETGEFVHVICVFFFFGADEGNAFIDVMYSRRLFSKKFFLCLQKKSENCSSRPISCFDGLNFVVLSFFRC